MAINDPVTDYEMRRMLAEPGLRLGAGLRQVGLGAGVGGGAASVRWLPQPDWPPEADEPARSEPPPSEPEPQAQEAQEPDPPMCAHCLKAGSEDGSPFIAGKEAA